jgi:hypothetical protein
VATSEEMETYLESEPSSPSAPQPSTSSAPQPSTFSVPQPSTSSVPQPSSSQASNFDPDFTLLDHHEKKKSDESNLKLNTKEWVKKLTPHADRGQLSNGNIFQFCVTTIQAGGSDLEDITLSEETIRKWRQEAQTENADTIRVNRR